MDEVAIYNRALSADEIRAIYDAGASGKCNFSAIVISGSVLPPGGGTIAGGGSVPVGSSVTLVATPASGYTFVNWTEKGKPVSTSTNYTFAATVSRELIANFTVQPDTQGPILTIGSPADDTAVNSESLTVTGTATDSGRGNNGVASVNVNGTDAIGGTVTGAGMANWIVTLRLNPGTNTINVVARDTLNNQTSRPITVIYNPPDSQGPALTITSPTDNATVINAALVVSGTATDSGRGNNGVASVTVNGFNAAGGAVSGTSTATWTSTISLSPGTNSITVIATDTRGNSATNQIAVRYEPQDLNPTISAITNVTTRMNVDTEIITFYVTDAQTPAEQLKVSTVSDNAKLIPNDVSFQFAPVDSSNPTQRQLIVRPAQGQCGSAKITILVIDQDTQHGQNADHSTNATFQITVVPAISASASGQNILITWPASAAGFLLEVSDDLTIWAPVAVLPGTIGDQNSVRIPVSGQRKFYRLRQQ